MANLLGAESEILSRGNRGYQQMALSRAGLGLLTMAVFWSTYLLSAFLRAQGSGKVQHCHHSAGPGHCCPGSDQWGSLGSRGRAAHSPRRSPRSQPRRQHWGHRIEPPTQLPGSVWGSVHSPHSVVITSQAGLDQAQRKPREQKMREARQACREPWCLQDAGRLLAGWGAVC